jgi:tetratricopeptide (TPR) repeat protein
LKELYSLSRHSSLAGFLWMINRGAVEDRNIVWMSVPSIVAMAPGHPLVLAQTATVVSAIETGELLAEHGLQLKQAREQFPNSYLLNTALVGHQENRKRFDSARDAAEIAVRCSPGNPQAWRSLGTTYYRWSNSIRQSRYSSDLNPEQLATCQKLYEQWLAVVGRGVELFPTHLGLGQALSNAAAFAGDMELADRTFWQVAARHPSDPNVLMWGLQLYHPKWIGDPANARKVAQMAANAGVREGGSWSEADRSDVALYTHLLGYPDLAFRITRGPNERKLLKQRVAAHASEVVPPGG